MFVKELHLVEDKQGDKWINVDALLWVIAMSSSEAQAIALKTGTPQAASAAGVVRDYASELRLALLRL